MTPAIQPNGTRGTGIVWFYSVMLWMLLLLLPAKAQTELEVVLARNAGVVGQATALASDEWPWSAIGRVNKNGAGFCTGILVSPDRVVTAAHCLWNNRTRQVHDPKYLTFVVGYDRGSNRAVRRVADYETRPCLPIVKYPAGIEDMTCDIALLILDQSIQSPAPVSLETGAVTLSDGAHLDLAGYRSDRPHMLSIMRNCQLLRAPQNRVLFHSCPSLPGSSGSPLLFWKDGIPVVVGVNVGSIFSGRDDKDGQIGIGAIWQNVAPN